MTDAAAARPGRRCVDAATVLERETAVLAAFVTQRAARGGGAKKRARDQDTAAAAAAAQSVSAAEVRRGLARLQEIIDAYGTSLVPAGPIITPLLVSLLTVDPRSAAAWRAAAAWSCVVGAGGAAVLGEVLDAAQRSGLNGLLVGAAPGVVAAIAQIILACGRHVPPEAMQRMAALVADAVEAADAVDASKETSLARGLLSVARAVLLVTSPAPPRLVAACASFLPRVRKAPGAPGHADVLALCCELDALLFQRVHPTSIPFYVPPQYNETTVAAPAAMAVASHDVAPNIITDEDGAVPSAADRGASDGSSSHVALRAPAVAHPPPAPQAAARAPASPLAAAPSAAPAEAAGVAADDSMIMPDIVLDDA